MHPIDLRIRAAYERGRFFAKQAAGAPDQSVMLPYLGISAAASVPQLAANLIARHDFLGQADDAIENPQLADKLRKAIGLSDRVGLQRSEALSPLKAHYNPMTNGMVIGRRTPLSVLAHEMGHAVGVDGNQEPGTKALRKAFNPKNYMRSKGLFGVGSLATPFAAGHYALNHAGSRGEAAAVGAASGLPAAALLSPVLREEYRASRTALDGLKRLAAAGDIQPHNIAKARRTLIKAFGSYGMTALSPVLLGGGWGAYRYGGRKQPTLFSS